MIDDQSGSSKRATQPAKRWPLIFLAVVLTLLATGLAGCTGTGTAPAGQTATPLPAPSVTSTTAAQTSTPAPTATPEVPVSETPATIIQETPMTTPPESTASPLHNLPQVEMARADLAGRLGLPAAEIEIVEVQAVTWPDTSMGCPQPGMAYAQVTQDGLLIRLQVEGILYNYHSGGSREPFLCQPLPASKSTPFNLELDDFQTPPPEDMDQ